MMAENSQQQSNESGSIGGYVIFHPPRQRVEVKAQAILGNQKNVIADWNGYIWADHSRYWEKGIGLSNEDPWVFSDPWLYSYCHATQLSRSQMKSGCILFFIDGNQADARNGDIQRQFVCDTVFVVDKKLDWIPNVEGRKWTPKELPCDLQHHKEKEDHIWERHLKHGLPDYWPGKKGHSGRYTFTGKQFSDDLAKRFSFLPADSAPGNNGCLSIPFESLDGELASCLENKCHGKYPCVLNPGQANDLYDMVFDLAEIKVTGNLKELQRENATGGFCGGCG